MNPHSTQANLQGIRQACRIAATVLHRMVEATAVGVTTYDLDQLAKRELAAMGARSACFNYNPRGSLNPYPAYTCISVNEAVVHGIPSIREVLKEGDVVSLDVVVDFEGCIGDNATTIVLGEVPAAVDRLVDSTREALKLAIANARDGNRVGDISHAVESYLRKQGLGIVRDFVGHGVGASMHEEPQIPNFGRARTGPRLKAGMTLAIEPMVTLGSHKIEFLPDGWTAVTRDRKPAAHFEHTVLVTEGDPEILTIPEI
jgi:methionyl aminopeptidase